MSGFSNNIESDINIFSIKNTVKELIPGAEVFLFGSRARGMDQDTSDYDLLIVVDQSISNTDRMLFQSKVRKRLAAQNILSDVIVQSRSDIEIKKGLTGHIVRTAFLEGVKL
jgi:predicted nucleotidyltransferase